MNSTSLTDGKQIQPMTLWYWPDEMVVDVAFAGTVYRFNGGDDLRHMGDRDRAVARVLLQAALADLEASS